MAESGGKKPKRVVALNGDKLGLVAGSVFATTVMALCFFYQDVDGITVAVRVGWTFVIAYAATFFLVRVILRTTLYEFVVKERERKSKRRGTEEPPPQTPPATSNLAGAEPH